MANSGNYALRLPASLKAEVEKLAKADGTTMNQFMVIAIAQKVSAINAIDVFRERVKRSDPNFVLELLSRPDTVPPREGDEIPESYLKRKRERSSKSEPAA